MKSETQQNQTLKQQFLQALTESESLCDALEACSMPRSILCGFLIKDKAFLKSFDKIINLKLEMALLETALKSKAAGVLSFSLVNRLPKKYNKTKKETSAEGIGQKTPAKIVYVQED